jgi:hypothetical protein
MGSSSRSRSGALPRASARASRVRSPAESAPTGPVRGSPPRTCSARGRSQRGLSSRPSRRCSSTLRCGYRGRSGATRPIDGRVPGSPAGVPKTSIRPSEGASSPALSAGSVDLPAPLGPTRAQTRPGAGSCTPRGPPGPGGSACPARPPRARYRTRAVSCRAFLDRLVVRPSPAGDGPRARSDRAFGGGRVLVQRRGEHRGDVLAPEPGLPRPRGPVGQLHSLNSESPMARAGRAGQAPQAPSPQAPEPQALEPPRLPAAGTLGGWTLVLSR